MFEQEATFRHFQCHGRIIHHERLGKPIFQCATCWLWSPDLLDLIIDPQIRTAETPKDNQTAVPRSRYRLNGRSHHFQMHNLLGMVLRPARSRQRSAPQNGRRRRQ